MINGRITENGIVNLDDDRVYYITVFPLNAVFLSYTVKTIGNNVYTNKDLCIKVSAKDEIYLLFCKRYPYVYSPTPFSSNTGLVSDFFSLVKQNRIDKARSFLSESLSKSVSDDALRGFFEKYEYIVKTDEKDLWLLATKDGVGEYFNFVIKNAMIDDISN
jgi:hypothetical protein